MHLTLKFKEYDANKIRCLDGITGTFVSESLKYQVKENVWDENRKRMVLKNVTRTVAETNKSVTTFPSGLLSFIRKKTNAHAGIVTFECDQIKHPKLKLKFKPTLPGIKFEKYQERLLKYVGLNKRGILVAPTGSGKSIIIGGIISKLNMPKTIVVCPNRTIHDQLSSALQKWFGIKKVGLIGNGLNSPSQVTVCTFQSLKKCNVKPELLIVDEGHEINPSIINFIKRNCANTHYRFGLTATPQSFENNFEKAANMVGYIGPILHEVEEVHTQARVLPVVVKFVKWHCENTIGETYQQILREDVLFSKKRNMTLLNAAKLELQAKRNVLFLIDEVQQGERIHKLAQQMGIESYFVHGKTDREEINLVKEALDKREINFVIATKIFGVGTDIPNVDCVVLGSSRKSQIDTIQKIGRGRRRTKHFDNLVVIDSIDSFRVKKYNKYFYNYSLKRMKMYEERKWIIKL